MRCFVENDFLFKDQDAIICSRAKEGHLPTWTEQLMLEQVKSILSNIDTVVYAVVFGSQASGKTHSGSDIDVAILGKAPFSLDERLTITQMIEASTGKNVDLIDLGQTSGLILKQIFESGTPVKNTDPDIIAKSMMKYYRTEMDYGFYRDNGYEERRKRVFGD